MPFQLLREQTYPNLALEAATNLFLDFWIISDVRIKDVSENLVKAIHKVGVLLKAILAGYYGLTQIPRSRRSSNQKFPLIYVSGFFVNFFYDYL